MLSKYDEEEEEAGMEIGAQGVVLDAKARQQADIRRRLAEGVPQRLAVGASLSDLAEKLNFWWSHPAGRTRSRAPSGRQLPEPMVLIICRQWACGPPLLVYLRAGGGADAAAVGSLAEEAKAEAHRMS